jgi:hypothetical protein
MQVAPRNSHNSLCYLSYLYQSKVPFAYFLCRKLLFILVLVMIYKSLSHTLQRKYDIFFS